MFAMAPVAKFWDIIEANHSQEVQTRWIIARFTVLRESYAN